MSDSCATPWTVAPQAPLSTGFPRQEYWSGLPLPSPGDLTDPESPALAGGFFIISHQGSLWLDKMLRCREAKGRAYWNAWYRIYNSSRESKILGLAKTFIQFFPLHLIEKSEWTSRPTQYFRIKSKRKQATTTKFLGAAECQVPLALLTTVWSPGSVFVVAAALKSDARVTSISVSFPILLQGVLGASCNRDVGVPFPGTHWPRSQNPLLRVYNHLNELLVSAGRSSEQLYLGYTEK